MDIDRLETPSLILDAVVMDHNIRRLQSRLRAANVPLRPHLKTSKCVQVARAIAAHGERGIAVSTLREAERFAAAGFRDILYAVVIAPDKLARAAALRAAGTELTLLIDGADIARRAAMAAARHGVELAVLIEVDVDGHRSGVDPAALEPLARLIASSPGLRLRGIASHAGSAYDCRGRDGIARVAERERVLMIGAARLLRDSGLPCEVVSVGSTPTAIAAESFAGITEVRAGVFVFNDLMQAQLGVCAFEDIALGVLCSVIGHHRAGDRLIVDAGWSALSQDSLLEGEARIFGRLCAADGRLLPDLAVTLLNQEHGIVTHLAGRPLAAREFPVGTKLRVLPVHACATASMHDGYQVLEDGVLAERWPRFGGWAP
jgi:D-serine deaminase-like pyridoxal phosphate-dependent protein